MSTGTNFYLDLYFGGVEGKLDFGNFWVFFRDVSQKAESVGLAAVWHDIPRDCRLSRCERPAPTDELVQQSRSVAVGLQACRKGHWHVPLNDLELSGGL